MVTGLGRGLSAHYTKLMLDEGVGSRWLTELEGG